MGVFKSRNVEHSGVACPVRNSRNVGLGFVDRVACKVLHACSDCGLRWRDGLIDLADEQLAERSMQMSDFR